MRTRLDACLRAVNEVLLGKEAQVRLAMACLLARGHLLVEDMPGMGKTTLSHALAKVLGLDFQRIQFTSDLLPGDILGTSVFDRTAGSSSSTPGRSSPSWFSPTRSTAPRRKARARCSKPWRRGRSPSKGRHAPCPSRFVIATQNPVSSGGTFALPESQLDRFLMRVSLGYPPRRRKNRCCWVSRGAIC